MTDLPSDVRHALSVVVLASVCLSARPGAAQSTAVAPTPIVLDNKKASHLVLNQVVPEYPALAKINYIQGQVRVQLTVSPEGQVAHAHVVRGHPILAASALKAIRRWLYRPLITSLGPAAFLTTIDMNFSLRVRKLDLLPRQAERDLDRQVKPPEVLQRPADPSPASWVRLRLLLSDNGQVIDSEPVKGGVAEFESAKHTLESWTFQPAHWGTLSVPWYLEVDVPVSSSSFHQAAADPGGR